MRIRLNDGSQQVDLQLPAGTPLAEAEGAARRLYEALAHPSEQPLTRTVGFSGRLDGVSLDSNHESHTAQPDRHDEVDHA